MRCPVLHVSLAQVCDKTAEINEFTILQLCLKVYDCVRPSMAELKWADQQSLDRVLNCKSACETFFIV
jgi:hypothetical protein